MISKTIIRLLRFVVLFLSFLCPISICVDPVTVTATVSGVFLSLGYAGWNLAYCGHKECCDKTWINHDLAGLKDDLKNNLYGQHLVESIIVKTVKAHLGRKEPKKALVMAFHGETGSGKNHVSKIIVRNIFKEGSNSQYVQWYIGTKDFIHKEDIKYYKDRLRKEIEEKTKLCERSLFVFDEVDKIPPGVLDVLTPYLDYHESVHNVDYRKNIFIFLSNAGATNITKVALDFWADGKAREDITLKDLEQLVTKGAFHEKGGLQHSDIVSRELIDVYVPFLPLEKKHVKMCINSELKLLNLRGDTNKIADQLEYFPLNTGLFSVYGCKKISAKVDLYAS